MPGDTVFVIIIMRFISDKVHTYTNNITRNLKKIKTHKNNKNMNLQLLDWF